MKEWISELLDVISYSKKAPFLLLAGSMLAVLALLLGELLAGNYSSASTYQELGSVVVHHILGKTEKAAGAIMVATTFGVYLQYQKDKKRYYRRMVG